MTLTSSQDSLLSDDPFYTVAGNSIQGSYIPASSGGTTAGSTAGSVMSVTSGGIVINLILDAAAQAAPASFKNGLQQAVAILAANITDKITVNINIDYSATGGGAAAGPDNGNYESYAWTRSELVNNASAGDATFNSLPTGSTIQGESNVAVWNAQLKLWGVLGANDTTTDDASATFATDINSNLLVGVALHELTHAMGRVPYGSAPDVFDFYRFTSPGVRLFSGSQTAPAAYFSLDGGVTKLADYGQNSDPSDFLNSGVQGPNDPFNEYYTGTTLQGLTSVDLKQLDALGFHLAVNSPATIEAAGITSLVQAGSDYFLDPTAGGAGPALKYGGSLVVAGAAAPWSPIAAEQTSSGYDVAWKDASSGQFSIWTVDSNGNFTAYLTGTISGTSTTLESLENTFHQDLNGDGTIGVPAAPTTVTIESNGSTTFDQIGNNYFLYASGSTNGPSLKFGGATVMVGQGGTWSPIAGEQTASGYDVAWHDSSSGQYSVWTTDSNGNFTSYLTGAVSGTSTALEALESTFHQDLNGDGNIGVVIESAGSTSLVLTGSNYYLNTSGSGPSLKIGGSLVVAGQAGTWSPIAAEQVSGGYDVAWKDSSSGQFSIWSTDSTGNFTAYLTGAIAGNSATLKSYEPIFHQDLNGDGAMGVAPLAVANNDQFIFAAAASSGTQTANASPADVSPHDPAWVSPQQVTNETVPDTTLGFAGHALAEYLASHHLDHWIVT